SAARRLRRRLWRRRRSAEVQGLAGRSRLWRRRGPANGRDRLRRRARGNLADIAVLVELLDQRVEFGGRDLVELDRDVVDRGLAVDLLQDVAVAAREMAGLARSLLHALPRLGEDRAAIKRR